VGVKLYEELNDGVVNTLIRLPKADSGERGASKREEVFTFFSTLQDLLASMEALTSETLALDPRPRKADCTSCTGGGTGDDGGGTDQKLSTGIVLPSALLAQEPSPESKMRVSLAIGDVRRDMNAILQQLPAYMRTAHYADALLANAEHTGTPVKERRAETQRALIGVHAQLEDIFGTNDADKDVSIDVIARSGARRKAIVLDGIAEPIERLQRITDAIADEEVYSSGYIMERLFFTYLQPALLARLAAAPHAFPLVELTANVFTFGDMAMLQRFIADKRAEPLRTALVARATETGFIALAQGDTKKLLTAGQRLQGRRQSETLGAAAAAATACTTKSPLHKDHISETDVIFVRVLLHNEDLTQSANSASWEALQEKFGALLPVLSPSPSPSPSSSTYKSSGSGAARVGARTDASGLVSSEVSTESTAAAAAKVLALFRGGLKQMWARLLQHLDFSPRGKLDRERYTTDTFYRAAHKLASATRAAQPTMLATQGLAAVHHFMATFATVLLIDEAQESSASLEKQREAYWRAALFTVSRTLELLGFFRDRAGLSAAFFSEEHRIKEWYNSTLGLAEGRAEKLRNALPSSAQRLLRVSADKMTLSFARQSTTANVSSRFESEEIGGIFDTFTPNIGGFTGVMLEYASKIGAGAMTTVTAAAYSVAQSTLHGIIRLNLRESVRFLEESVTSLKASITPVALGGTFDWNRVRNDQIGFFTHMLDVAMYAPAQAWQWTTSSTGEITVSDMMLANTVLLQTGFILYDLVSIYRRSSKAPPPAEAPLLAKLERSFETFEEMLINGTAAIIWALIKQIFALIAEALRNPQKILGWITVGVTVWAIRKVTRVLVLSADVYDTFGWIGEGATDLSSELTEGVCALAVRFPGLESITRLSCSIARDSVTATRGALLAARATSALVRGASLANRAVSSIVATGYLGPILLGASIAYPLLSLSDPHAHSVGGRLATYAMSSLLLTYATDLLPTVNWVNETIVGIISRMFNFQYEEDTPALYGPNVWTTIGGRQISAVYANPNANWQSFIILAAWAELFASTYARRPFAITRFLSNQFLDFVHGRLADALQTAANTEAARQAAADREEAALLAEDQLPANATADEIDEAARAVKVAQGDRANAVRASTRAEREMVHLQDLVAEAASRGGGIEQSFPAL
jgi:hypothetical protein